MGQRGRLGVVVLAVAAAALGAAGWSTVELLAAGRAERTADAATRISDAGAQARAAELAGARVELRTADAGLATALWRLDTAVAAVEASTDDRAAVAAELAEAERLLHAVRGELAGARSEAALNESLVVALGDCLDGVHRLLNQIAVGDDAGASRTLASVAPDCAEVGTVLG